MSTQIQSTDAREGEEGDRAVGKHVTIWSSLRKHARVDPERNRELETLLNIFFYKQQHQAFTLVLRCAPCKTSS